MTFKFQNLLKASLIFGLMTGVSLSQQTDDPFPTPIEAEKDVITIGFKEFAMLPHVGENTALAMDMELEPGGNRYFVNDLHGFLYTVSSSGDVTKYLDLSDPKWTVDVRWTVLERGFTGLALHPEFNQKGAPGYGKIYTLLDTSNKRPTPDFTPEGGNDAHDTLLLEWTAKDASAATYDGDAPRELMRMEQPFGNHNGGQIAFNPLATAGTADYGNLYISNGDGGSGGDPMNMSQMLSSIFGKMLRINPLGSNSKNGKYGIPADNPFANASDASVLKEIYAYGTRSPNRIAWDSKDGQMYVADIGQNIVEEVSKINNGANLGWKPWEGSFRYISRSAVEIGDPRNDPDMIFPVVEYDQTDPLFQRSVASSGLAIYRNGDISKLNDKILFAELASGEIFYVSADKQPEGGQDAIRRILLKTDAGNKTFLEVIQAKNIEQDRDEAMRADIRMAYTADGKLFLLNKRDGVIRLVTN